MFEFLKECNNFTIYERAVSCEKIIGDVNDTLIFRVFCEAAIKSIYDKEIGINFDDGIVKFQDLLNNAELIEILNTKYGFKSIGTLDRIIRVKGNSTAHDEHPDKVSDESRIQQFICIYTLASCIYHVRTGKNAPVINKKDVLALIEKKKNPEDIEKIKREYEKQIIKITAELETKGIEKDTKIAELERQIAEAIENAANAEADKKRIEKELETEKYKNIDSAQRKEMEHKIAEQEKMISSFEGDISILKSRLEKAEKINNEESISKLQEKNEKLRDKLIIATSELSDYKKQLELLAENSCNKSVVDSLKRELAAMQKDLKNKNEVLADVKKKLAEEKSKQVKTDTPFSAFEEKFKGYREIAEEKDDLEAELQQMYLWVNENAPHLCKNCNKRLVISNDFTAWRCRDWKTEKNQHLPSAYRDLSPEERKVFANPLLEIKHNIEIKNNEIHEWLRENAPDADPITPIKASAELLEKASADTVDFSNYPLSLTKYEPRSAIFQSLSVPSEVFKIRETLQLKNHSKFRIWFDTLLTDNSCVPTEEERTIYSLVLRLLNRGIVLKSSTEVEQALKKRFNQYQFGRVNALTDYIEYRNPVMNCDSERERRFAQEYFPKILGKSWASYVTAQPAFDELLLDTELQYENCRADFMIAGYSNLVKPLIIELDGYEHKNSIDYDKTRRMALRNSGFEVLSFSNHDVDTNNQSIFYELKNYFDAEKENATVEADNRYLVACKIQHQFAIAIVKALEIGCVGSKSKFTANVSSTMFNDSEISFILDMAIFEVELLINKYCELYGFNFDVDLKNDDSKAIEISIGDGKPGFGGITIRDNFFKWDYLCDLIKFNPEIQPSKNVREGTLRFFLNYIFGHKKFNSGQLPAIKKLMRKEDCVALLPTGSGKSIIYQLTSYLVPGMIVVISPLKSLINDQISNLDYKNGINNAIGIYSRSGKDGKALKEKDLQHMNCNASSLLYIAPERVQIPNFRNHIERMLRNNNVFAVAVDEAHCVSEWGHDFRPAYLVIGKNCRKIFSDISGSPALVALTGTASTRVRADILRILGIEKNAVIYPDSFERDNLKFSVVECDSDVKASNLSYIIRNDLPDLFNTDYDTFCIRDGEKTNSGIVFTPFTKGKQIEYSARNIETSLRQTIPNIRIETYFSSVPKDYDKATWEAKIAENAKLFRENEINLLVATKAFGMGIDKGNIRFTIHDCFPSSIESFYQEAGRAGRDNKESHCIILFSDDNRDANAKLLDASLTLEDLRSKYNNSSSEDDIHAQLYFHLSGFRGIKNECYTVNKLIDYLPQDCTSGKSFTISLKNSTFSYEEQNDNGKPIAQAVVRLMNLGVLDDYLYDYVESKFILTTGSLDRASINRHFADYVKSFNLADVGVQLGLLQKVSGTSVEALKDIAKLMIEYTYSQIEHGRRQQLITIYGLMLKVISEKSSNQDRLIKDEINNYFALPKKAKGDPIIQILDSPEIRFDIALSTFGIDQGKTQFNITEVQTIAEMAGRAAHELESASTRPDLILLRDIAQIISGRYNNSLIANDIVAVSRFAIEQYYIDLDVINETLEKTYNFIISKDTKLFDEVIERMARYKKQSLNKIITSLMNSMTITDESRDYLVLKYYTDNIQHML